MSVWLRMGRETIQLDLYRRWGRPPVLAPSASALHARVREAAGEERQCVQQDRVASFERALDSYDGQDSFLNRAAAARSVCVVCPDRTRRGPWEHWIEPFLDWIEPRTPAAHERTLLAATGVHRPEIPDVSNERSGWSLGANGENRYRSHREVGVTPAGTPVRLHPRWTGADLRIAIGDVTFHYFAGFGGGRKLVFPGLAEPEGILRNHRRTLDEVGMRIEACAPGRLEGNPVHEDLLSAASLCPPHLLFQVHEVEPGGGEHLQVGDWREVHEEGCRNYLAGHLLDFSRRPALLIVDAGGAPRDTTFLQAHKSLQHAALFAELGGRILLVASLDGGVGSETLENLWGCDATALTRQAVADYQLHTHTALALRSVTDRFEVAVWSGIDGARIRKAGLTPLASEQEALDWMESAGTPHDWGWIPRADETLPRFFGVRTGRGNRRGGRTRRNKEDGE